MEIYIRPIDENDTDSILEWRNSDYVRSHFIFQDELRKEVHLDWLYNKVYKNLAKQYIICLTDNNKKIGTVYFSNIDKKHNKAEFGIYIAYLDKKYKGYGLISTILLLKIGFEELGLHKIYLRVFQDNLKAIKMYKKVGFKEEGLFKNDVYINGIYRNVVFMSIFQDVFNEKSVKNYM